jgi:rod shape-determining protein MreC
MLARRRMVDWSLAGLLLLLPALILRSSLKTGELSPFDEAVLRVSAPLESAVSWVVEGVGGVWSRYVALVGVERENRELRAENDKLREELARASRRAFDAEALEELVELKKRTPADTLAARVIAASTSPFFRVVRIRIDRGEHEVAPDMPVVTSAGLVGRIKHVYGAHADVVLLSDPDSAVDVVISSTGGRGVLKGLGRDDSYACKIEWLERSGDPGGKGAVHVGDKVVTSGLGGAFPAGITVGTVSAVRTNDYKMFQAVEVEPAVELSHLRAVMVLLAPPPPPDPHAGDLRKSEPAFGVRPL